jgi:hypothetical protein
MKMRASADHRANVALATGVLVVLGLLVLSAGVAGIVYTLASVVA